MSQADRGDKGPVDERPVRGRDVSFARGAASGIASVTFATLLLGVAGALIALVVSLAH